MHNKQKTNNINYCMLKVDKIEQKIIAKIYRQKDENNIFNNKSCNLIGNFNQ